MPHLHIIEISHVSYDKSSITLRVNHVGGKKSAIRTRAKVKLFSELQKESEKCF